MASRKMTFTIPESVAAPFLRTVRGNRRSSFVAEALRKEMQAREKNLIAACNAVNANPEINTLIDDWQAVSDPIEEPWDDSAAR